MALCMALTLLPVQVPAADYTVGEDTSVSARALAGTAGTKLKADNIATYIANGLGGGVYTLAEDVTISGTLKVTGTVTLDLNDHVLTITGENQFITVSGKNTSMTLTDSAETKTERKFSVNQNGVWVLDENGDQTVSGGVITGGIFYGAVANGYNRIDPKEGEVAGEGTRGLITNGTFYGEVTNAFSSKISGGSFYGKVDNRDRSDFRPTYRGILAGGTFYAGNPGTVANGCCTVTYDYGKVDGTYAIQIVKKDEEAVRPADPKLNGFDFGDWLLKNGTPYNFSAPVTGDLTLTAGWCRIVPGSGTEEDPYRISNAEELQAFRDIVNGENGQTQNTAACAVLTADIDLENQLWTPIGSQQNPYRGTFDGGGYAIRNLYVNNSEAYTGLFGSAHNATFRNLTITGSVTANSSGGYSGGLLGSGTGTLTITNCINAATVTSSEAARGLVGIFTAQDQSDTLTITGCANLGTVTAEVLSAGIISQITGTGLISDCYNAGRLERLNQKGFVATGGMRLPVLAWQKLTTEHEGGTATCASGAVCEYCGRAYGAKDADNHDLKHVAAKAPGTYVRGNTEYWQCRDCGKYFADARAALEIKAADVIIYPTGGSTGGKSSSTTFDAGIGVCAVTAFTSLMGLALLRRKRRDEE